MAGYDAGFEVVDAEEVNITCDNRPANGLELVAAGLSLALGGELSAPGLQLPLRVSVARLSLIGVVR